jgi:LuxR family transcriptional regulator, maltose regulon positive regulatory protein
MVRPVPPKADTDRTLGTPVSPPEHPNDEQVEILLRSASFEEATETLSAAWRGYLPDRVEQLAERIAALPEEHLNGAPELIYALGYCALIGRPRNPFLAIACFDAAQEHDPSLGMLCALGRSRARRALGRFDDAMVEVAEARRRLREGAGGIRSRIELESRVLFEEAACLALTGHLDGAARSLEHGLGLLGDAASPASREAAGWLALTEALGGRSIGRHDLSSPPGRLAWALGLVDEERVDEAADAVADLEQEAVGTEFVPFALVLRSMLSATVHERLDLLQTARLRYHDWQSPVLIAAMHDAERVCALLQLGRVGAAREAIAAQDARSPMLDRHIHCTGRLAARLALHVGDFEGVLTATEPCLALGDGHAPRPLACVDVLRSAAYHALGDTGTAARAMDRALADAARTGWLRPFTSIPGSRLTAMLAVARERAQPPEVVAVLDELQRRAAVDGEAVVEPLTVRERIILSRLVSGQSRQQMSSELRVSPNTIKSQVRTIYRKLGAANRHEAIDRADTLGIAR